MAEQKINFGRLKWYEHLACGWPLILVFLGGAVGGGCGGAAYAISGRIFLNDKLSAGKKYGLSVLVGLGAIVLYVIIVAILVTVFPGMNGQKAAA